MPRVTVAQAELPTKPHALYRFYDRTDVLLYVGISLDLPARLRAHRRGKPWWLEIANITIEPFDSRDEALAAEARAIREEKPLYNDQHNPTVRLPDPTACGCEPCDCERDDYEDGGDLGAVILEDLSPFERDLVIAKLEALPDDERVYQNPTAEAGRLAADFLQESRLQLDAAIFALTKVLPDELRSQLVREAHDLIQHHLGEDYTDYDVTSNVLYRLVAHVRKHGLVIAPVEVG